jgi:hypothetical protein
MQLGATLAQAIADFKFEFASDAYEQSGEGNFYFTVGNVSIASLILKGRGLRQTSIRYKTPCRSRHK